MKLGDDQNFMQMWDVSVSDLSNNIIDCKERGQVV